MATPTSDRKMYADDRNNIQRRSKRLINGIKMSKNRLQSAKKRGKDALVAKSWITAYQCFTAAIELDPLDATFYASRASAHIGLSQFSQAKQDLYVIMLLC